MHNVKGGLGGGWEALCRFRRIIRDFPHSKNGSRRRAAKHRHTGCMSDPGVTIIVVVVVVVVVVEAYYFIYIIVVVPPGLRPSFPPSVGITFFLFFASRCRTA